MSRWYIIHAMSGHEKKVAQTIREKALQHNLQDQIEDVVVPMEEVIEVRNGKKVAAERKFYPGYILVKMELNDRTWHLVKNVPSVSGFLGGGGKPQPIPEREAEKIFSQMREGVEKPKHSVIYEVGESVKVIDGPFESFVGVVEEVEEEKARLKLSVSIFGRPTPVDLEFSQVEKV